MKNDEILMIANRLMSGWTSLYYETSNDLTTSLPVIITKIEVSK
jgi:muramidase (phage lysozyme)